MKTRRTPAFVNTSARRQNLVTVALTCIVVSLTTAAQAADPLASWNDGPAKQAIVEFVKATTTQGSPQFVPPEERIATFDQDGTLWVEHPMYTQVMYCLEKVPALVKAKPELAKVAPFNTVLELLHGDRAAMEKLTMADLEKIPPPRSPACRSRRFQAEAKQWFADAKHPRWKKALHRADLPPHAGGAEVSPSQWLQDLHRHRRRTGLCARICRGDLRHSARAGRRLGAGGTKYGYDKDGKPFLTKEPKLVLNDNDAGKPEGIHLMIGRRPHIAFGNSTGDQQMLEYTKAGDGARLSLPVLHDDAEREYAYGPATGLPDTKVGTFTQALYDEAKKNGWTLISMKNDWKIIFSFESK